MVVVVGDALRRHNVSVCPMAAVVCVVVVWDRLVVCVCNTHVFVCCDNKKVHNTCVCALINHILFR